jgi:hypothetical protein
MRNTWAADHIAEIARMNTDAGDGIDIGNFHHAFAVPAPIRTNSVKISYAKAQLLT